MAPYKANASMCWIDYYPPSLLRHLRPEGMKVIHTRIRAGKRAWQIIIIRTHAPRHLLDTGLGLCNAAQYKVTFSSCKTQNYYLFDIAGGEVLRPLQGGSFIICFTYGVGKNLQYIVKPYLPPFYIRT